jgi:arylsulfatase A-like enzyme
MTGIQPEIICPRDASIKNVTDLLKKNQMWDNTVLVFSADNGKLDCIRPATLY